MDYPRLARLQAALDLFTGLFDRVGLRTNFNKTAEMVCQPCQMACNYLELAYWRQVTGVGPYSQERHQERVRCPEGSEELAAGSLDEHHEVQNGTSLGTQWAATPPPQPPEST